MPEKSLPASSNFSLSVAGKFMICMIILTLSMILIICIIENISFKKIHFDKKYFKKFHLGNVNEEQMISDPQFGADYTLTAKNLHKIYYTPFQTAVHAVNGISFGVKHGECFGLLGVNGAGKSTTFDMLTKVQHPSHGKITFADAVDEFLCTLSTPKFGFCPQTDCLDEYLTPKETIEFFANLHHIKPSHLERYLQKLISSFEMQDTEGRLVGTLSFGNRRKLSSLISTIGQPSIIFMDEPTTGMDPASKRFLWRIVRSIVLSGTSVVLTSHSMEECQVLCDRVAIMVDGKFRCLGSPQHLKEKYSKGYEVVINCLNKDKILQLQEAVMSEFENALLLSIHGKTLKFSVSLGWDRLHEIYRIINQLKKEFQIKSISISQPTLEQVFLGVATN